MLIYNSKKEFVGIDEKALKIFGYKDLASLKAEVADFADLFVKTPGYVHNFKHVHWIDFITCAQSNEVTKVIVNINNKNYKSRVSITTLYLTESPSSKAYAIYLNNLRELNAKESEVIAEDISTRSVSPITSLDKVEKFDRLEKSDLEVPKNAQKEKKASLESDVNQEEVLPQESKNISQKKDTKNILDIGDKEPASQTDNEYVYDPHVASIELGLPLDLIEEFVQDFILQAQEFKENLYHALDQAEYNQVKMLSHKLKGVAANLRIEDAFNALSVVNTADNPNIILKHLNIFYESISKLADAKMLAQTESESQEEAATIFEKMPISQESSFDEEDELYKNLLDIEDSEVAQKIALPQFKDDDLATDLNSDPINNEIDSIKESDVLEQKQEKIEDIFILDTEDAPPIMINYSKQKSANEIGIDLNSFNELFEDYLHESGIIINEIKRGVENDDLAYCQHEALKLKTMSSNMRINCFLEEIDVIMHSEDTEEILYSVERVEKFITQISKIET